MSEGATCLMSLLLPSLELPTLIFFSIPLLLPKGTFMSGAPNCLSCTACLGFVAKIRLTEINQIKFKF